MKNQILKTFLVNLFMITIIPTTSKAADADWGTARISVGETIIVNMSSSMKHILSSPYSYDISCNWTSFNSGIATVQQIDNYTCKVTGVTKGTVRINCSVFWMTSISTDGSVGVPNGINGYITVTVKDAVKVDDIRIYPSSVFLAPNEQKQLEANVYPSIATNQNVSWSTSAPTIVDVSNDGLLTAKDYGTATITCSATDGSGVTATCNVTVDDRVPINGITLKDYKGQVVKEISLGTESPDDMILYVQVSPQNTTESITCTSSNPDVVWVWWDGENDNGTIKYELKAKTEGSAIITCSAVNDNNIKATCLVNVYKYGDGGFIWAKTIEGIDVEYYITDATNRTCRVYRLGRNNATVSGEITIPSEVEGFKITGIGNAFSWTGKYITKVNLPSSVEEIGEKAFEDCTSLSSIALDNVKYIGEKAFSGCTSLSEITGINNLEYIGYNAFYKTPWYDKLPDGLLYLGKVLYKYKGSIPADTEITVNEGTVSISPLAFSVSDYSYYNIVSITLPKSMSNVSEESFRKCSGLKKIVVAEGNKTYDSRNNCNAIIETNTNTLVTGCIGTVIPEGVKIIGKQAFYEYRAPETVTIPNSVESIEDEAFYLTYCNSVNIGNGLRKLGKDVFYNVNSFSVSEDNPYFDSRDNCNAIIESGTNKLVVASESTTIPYSVKTIGKHAYFGIDDITEINLHDGVEIVEEEAFYNIDFLKLVKLGKGIRSIGKHAFISCKNLKGISSNMTNPPAVDEEAFGISWNNEKQKYDCKETTLYVPKGAKINHMTTKGWSMFEKIVEIDENSLIDGERFTDKTIEGVELTFEVKNALDKTCELVESPTTIKGKLTIPNAPLGYTVVGIDQNVFKTKNITEVVIPSGIGTIGSYAFYNCTSLQTIQVLNPNPIEIEESVFACSSNADKVYNSAILYVPIGSKTKYMANAVWKKFKTIKEGNPPVLVTSIKLNNGTLTLTTGETSQLTAEITPENATNKTVTWSSSNANIATVSSKGLVTAIAKGSATITCKADDESGVKATCIVTVKALPPTSISIPESATVEVGSTITLTPTFVPANASATLGWTSDDKTIASVNGRGVVTGIKRGQTSINVKTDNGKTAVCKLTVNGPILVTSIKLNNESLTLKAGDTSQLTAEVTPEDATDKTVTWSSSNENVAAVSNSGLVTAKSAGTATITCKAADKSGVKATCKITVEIPSPTKIYIPESASVEVGSTITLTPTFEPANASASLTWSSDDETIATVTSKGVVTGVKRGQTSINVTTDNGKNAVCKVTVNGSILVTAINLNSTTLTLKAGDTAQLTATITPEDATNKTVTWSSNNENVATVNSTGLVTAKSAGNATITCIANDGSNISAKCTITVESANIKGDVNGDGEVNGTDLVALTNIILGRKEKTEAADVNGDGEVNGTDYVTLVNIILGRHQALRKANTTTTTSLSIDSSFDIKAGQEKELLVNLTNPNDMITLVQFDLRLPSGLSLKQVDGEYEFDMAGRSTWRKHSLDVNDMNGIIRFILSSNSNTALSGTEGAIIKMTIKADDSFTNGDIQLENILMVSPDEKETKQGTYVYSIGTTEPPIQETTGLAFVKFDIDNDGDTELVIGLNNPDDEITLVQFDLSLPSGLTLKQTDGEFDIDIVGRTTWKKHSLDANALNGIIRFLLASGSNAILSGTEGAVIKMAVQTDKNFNSGTVKLENILLVTPNEKEIKPSAISFIIDPVGVNTISADGSDRNTIYNLSGQRVVAPRKGINIIHYSDGTSSKVLIK